MIPSSEYGAFAEENHDQPSYAGTTRIRCKGFSRLRESQALPRLPWLPRKPNVQSGMFSAADLGSWKPALLGNCGKKSSFTRRLGAIAQLVERLVRNEKAGSSTLPS